MEKEQLKNIINEEGVIDTMESEDIDLENLELTFKETLGAYALAATFVVGAVTIGYGVFKGGQVLGRKIKEIMDSKKVEIQESEEEIKEVEE